MQQWNHKFVWTVSLLLVMVSCSDYGNSFTANSPSPTLPKPTSPILIIPTTPATVTNRALPPPTETSTPSWVNLPEGLYLFFHYEEREGLYALSFSDRRVTKVLDQYVSSAI